MNDRSARQLIVAMELLRRAVTDSAASQLAAMKAGADPSKHGTGKGGGDILGFTEDGKFVKGAEEEKIPGAAGGWRTPGESGGKKESGRGKESDGKAGTDGKALAGLIVAGFGRILAPLTALGAVVSGLLSGFSIVTSALRVFAATLAPILLPVFVLLAATIIAASDVIWSKLKPALDGWYALVMSQGVPVVEAFIDGLKDAAEAVVEFAHWVERQSHRFRHGVVAGTLGSLETRQAAEKERVAGVLGRGRNDTGAGNYEGGASSGGGGDYGGGADKGAFGRVAAAGAAPKTTSQLVNSALKDTIKELRLQQGPQASFTGVSQAVKNVQLAAINASPFEQKMLERMGTALDKLEKLVGNTEAKPTRRYE
jgi:hypothetical protein